MVITYAVPRGLDIGCHVQSSWQVSMDVWIYEDAPSFHGCIPCVDWILGSSQSHRCPPNCVQSRPFHTQASMRMQFWFASLRSELQRCMPSPWHCTDTWSSCTSPWDQAWCHGLHTSGSNINTAYSPVVKGWTCACTLNSCAGTTGVALIGLSQARTAC